MYDCPNPDCGERFSGPFHESALKRGWYPVRNAIGVWACPEHADEWRQWDQRAHEAGERRRTYLKESARHASVESKRRDPHPDTRAIAKGQEERREEKFANTYTYIRAVCTVRLYGTNVRF